MQVFRHFLVSAMSGMRLAIPATTTETATDMNNSGETFISNRRLGSTIMCNTMETVRTKKKINVARTYRASFCLPKDIVFSFLITPIFLLYKNNKQLYTVRKYMSTGRNKRKRLFPAPFLFYGLVFSYQTTLSCFSAPNILLRFSRLYFANCLTASEKLL